MNPHTPKHTRKKRRVSVIIPGYGRKETLRACLVSLSKQTQMPEEVIVTDNSGGYAVRMGVDSFRKKYPVRLRYVFVAKKGAGNARTAGIALAKSPLLAFIDDDCIPKKTWIAELVRSIGTRQNVIIQGRNDNGLPDDLFASLNHFKDQQYLQSGVYDMLTGAFSPWFDAKNSLIARALFLKKLLAFRDVELEDLDLTAQSINRRIRIVYAPQAVVFHFGRTSFLTSLFRWVRMGAGRYKLEKQLAASGVLLIRSDSVKRKVARRERNLRKTLLQAIFKGRGIPYQTAFLLAYRLSIVVTEAAYVIARLLRL